MNLKLDTVPESDWKVFRELREFALDRFYRGVLEELDLLRGDDSQSHHKRYSAIFRMLQKRDDELAHAFDNPRRSQMILQLGAMYSRGLLAPDEIARFTSGTRETVEFLAKANGPSR